MTEIGRENFLQYTHIHPLPATEASGQGRVFSHRNGKGSEMKFRKYQMLRSWVSTVRGGSLHWQHPATKKTPEGAS